jgi:acetamidase/formamidase
MTYSFAHPPALHIKPGDRVVTTTLDAAGFDADGQKVAPLGNPQTGPFYIDGAEPGDSVLVTLVRITPNREFGFSLDLITPNALDPIYLRSAAKEQRPQIAVWKLDEEAGTAQTANDERVMASLRKGFAKEPGTRNLGFHDATPSVKVQLRPSLGCIATAPAQT